MEKQTSVPLRFFFLYRVAVVLHLLNILPRRQNILHMFTRRVVLAVQRFLLGGKRGVFGFERIDRRELFKPQRVKILFRRLMRRDVVAMIDEVFFRVTGFPVCGVNIAGLAVNADMLLQSRYVFKPRVDVLYTGADTVEIVFCRLRLFVKFIKIVEAVLLQENEGGSGGLDMDMAFINVRCYDESVAPFGETHGKFIP